MRHPLATDLVEFVDEQPAEMRMILAHIACCEPCRRGVINIIQTNDEYPDLFANPSLACTSTPSPDGAHGLAVVGRDATGAVLPPAPVATIAKADQ
jgi:hypothetical protein